MRAKIYAWACTLLVSVISVGSFVALLLLIRTMDKPLWSQEAAGWAQAIGSVAAIAAAFHIGAKQSHDAIKSIVFGYDHATRRRYEAYSVIARSAKEHSESTLAIFPEEGFSTLHFLVAQLDKKRESLIAALDAIPIHEVGTYEAVENLVGLRISMGHLNKAIARAKAHLDSFGSAIPQWVPFDTAVIRLNCEMAITQATDLMDALGRPFNEPSCAD